MISPSTAIAGMATVHPMRSAACNRARRIVMTIPWGGGGPAATARAPGTRSCANVWARPTRRCRGRRYRAAKPRRPSTHAHAHGGADPAPGVQHERECAGTPPSQRALAANSVRVAETVPASAFRRPARVDRRPTIQLVRQREHQVEVWHASSSAAVRRTRHPWPASGTADSGDCGTSDSAGFAPQRSQARAVHLPAQACGRRRWHARPLPARCSRRACAEPQARSAAALRPAWCSLPISAWRSVATPPATPAARTWRRRARPGGPSADSAWWC